MPFGSLEIVPATRVTPSVKAALSCAAMSEIRTNRSSVKGVAKPTTLLSKLSTLMLSPPEPALPQVTTEPSLSSAAKAESVEKIWETVWPLKLTLLLSPPEPALPQVTTEPSLSSAAKANALEKIWETVWSFKLTPEVSMLMLSPSVPQVTTEPSLSSAAKA